MHVNDQKPSYMSEKTTLNDHIPVTLKKKDMVLVLFLYKKYEL